MNRQALDAKLYDWHFPAGPKAPAPVRPFLWFQTDNIYLRARFGEVYRAIAAALKERNAT